MTRSYHNFTEEEKNYIFTNYKSQNARQLSDNINNLYNSSVSMEQVNRFKVRNKLKSGIPFKCWELPKTKKQREAVANNIRKFNYSRKKQIGYEYTNVEGVLFIKYKDEKNKHNNYMRKSRYIYEKHNGKIHDNYIVLHLDGNKSNNDIDNLVAIPKSCFEFLRTRGLIFKDKEINKIAILSTNLLFKANRKKTSFFNIDKTV